MALERELEQQKATNVRLHDAEVAANREVEGLRERNVALMRDSDQMRSQIRIQ